MNDDRDFFSDAEVLEDNDPRIIPDWTKQNPTGVKIVTRIGKIRYDKIHRNSNSLFP